MKIAIIIASRNNPQGLETVISTLSFLDSGKHALSYYVAHDSDDEMTPRAIARLKQYGMDVHSVVGSRPLYLGQPYNDIALAVEADVYCTVTDRFIPLTQFWDQAVALAVKNKEDGVFWWNSQIASGQMTFPVVTAKWLRAAGGIYPACFPFWFDDTWLSELHALVHGLPHLVLPAFFANVRKHPTKRLRDLRFWMDFYIAKTSARIAHADDIIRKLGIPPPDRKGIFEECRFREAFWNERWQELEKAYGGESKEPDATYLAAKANAEAFMTAARGAAPL